MEADGAKLETRNGYNLSAMSIEPEMVKKPFKSTTPNFELDYDVDPERQNIASTWPDSIDTSCSRGEDLIQNMI